MQSFHYLLKSETPAKIIIIMADYRKVVLKNERKVYIPKDCLLDATTSLSSLIGIMECTSATRKWEPIYKQ